MLYEISKITRQNTLYLEQMIFFSLSFSAFILNLKRELTSCIDWKFKDVNESFKKKSVPILYFKSQQ